MASEPEPKEIKIYECSRCGCRVEEGMTFNKKYEHIYRITLLDYSAQVCDPCLSWLRNQLFKFGYGPIHKDSMFYKVMVEHEERHERELAKRVELPQTAQ